MKIVVLGGGDSTEREVSLRSAAAVSGALVEAGYEVINLDPINVGVIDSIAADSIVFPILHGKNGEDGKIQAMLEARKLSFLGSGSNSSAVCFDKAQARQAFEQAGLPIAPGGVVTSETYSKHELYKKPHVLKVCEGGSSIGTYIVKDPSNISTAAVEEVFGLDDEAIIEELVIGTEITVPILDTRALPVIEIIPPVDKEFDYENKYNGKTQEICPPVSIDQNIQKQAREYAEIAHKSLGCRHLSRVDMMVRPDGRMVLLEINTMPGMTNQSLYPKSAAASGLTFPELMKQFVKMVLNERNSA